MQVGLRIALAHGPDGRDQRRLGRGVAGEGPGLARKLIGVGRTRRGGGVGRGGVGGGAGGAELLVVAAQLEILRAQSFEVLGPGAQGGQFAAQFVNLLGIGAQAFEFVVALLGLGRIGGGRMGGLKRFEFRAQRGVFPGQTFGAFPEGEGGGAATEERDHNEQANGIHDEIVPADFPRDGGVGSRAARGWRAGNGCRDCGPGILA